MNESQKLFPTRPESLNALNNQMRIELKDALTRTESDPEIAVIITGTGRAFCAGIDLKEIGSNLDSLS